MFANVIARPVTVTVAFFVLTYLWSWTFFVAAAAISNGVGGGAFGIAGLAGPVLLLGAFMPAAVAAGLTLLCDGPDGVRALLRQVVEPPVQLRWYVFAILFFAAVKLVVALLYRAIAGAWPAFGSEPWYVLAVAIVFSTPVQIGEELGGRAYALPRLSEHMGLVRASIVLGMIWAAWHLPLFSLSGSDKAGQSFPFYAVEVTAMSVAAAWLYWRTNGRLLLTMLMHAAVNNTKDIVPSAVVGATNRFALSTSLAAWLTAGVLWAVAIVFLIQMRGVRALANSHKM